MEIKSLIVFSLLCFILTEAKTLHLRRQPFQLSHQYTSSRSVGGGGIAGFIIGPILFIWSFILIWNNERKAAIDHRRITLAQKIVREVNPFNPEQVRSANGQLVHIAGDSQCSETVTDPESGIRLSGVVKIKRQVQVKEIRGSGSDRNRTYHPMWVTSHDSTPGGGYTNDPGAWFIKSGQTKAKNIFVGNYRLSDSLIDKLQCSSVYTPEMQNAYNIASRSGGRVRGEPVIQGEYIYFPSSPGTIDAPGTLRVKYVYCNTGSTSVISQSERDSFVPFRIDVKENGKPDTYGQDSHCCCCLLSDCTAKLLAPMTEIDFISQQKQSYHEMMQKEKKDISLKKNLIRFAAYFLMVLSICAFFSPITTLLGYVPLLGGILSNVVGLAIFLAAIIVCIPLFLLAVSICWLIFHPKVGLILLGVALLVTGAVLAIIFVNKGKDNGQAAQTAKHLVFSLRSVLK